MLFDVADVLAAPSSAPPRIAPRAAPGALAKLERAVEGPNVIFPPDGATVQVEALGPGARGLVLAAGGDGLSWYVEGRPLPVDPVSGRTVWKPDAPGFYELTVIDAEGRSARSKVRIRNP